MRNALYKLIYGSRAAVEEIILQSDSKRIPNLTLENDESSITPYTTFLGVKFTAVIFCFRVVVLLLLH